MTDSFSLERHRSTKAVLVDLDDTLFDHRYCSRRALEAVWRGHGCLQKSGVERLERQHRVVLEELHRGVLDGRWSIDEARLERFRRLFAAAGAPPSAEIVASAASLYRETYLRSRRPTPGAIALLERLRPAARVGIVTNNLVAEQTSKLEACGMGSLVDVLVASEEAGVTKPDPAIFAIAVKRLGCKPEESVMLGDSWDTDIVGALRAGVRAAAWLNRDGGPCPDSRLAVELRSLEPPDHVAELLLSLPASEFGPANADAVTPRSR
ncbi:MAG: HAD-IA family hydrolase [Acidobacteria bacterium]|nr:HAD-IA family hydrolase [Acidobacteriota bacterium]